MYKPAEKSAWKGQTDVQDGAQGYRWHQVMELLDLSRDFPEGEGGIAFLGFCCDEGVRRNQGRVGAASGPAAIRLALASLADHLPDEVQLYGCGDVFCSNQKMEEAQAQLGRKVLQLLNRNYKVIVMGGGHETAYGHFLGIQQWLPSGQKVGIINLDAHFDLRSYKAQPSSSTPFLQIAHALEKEGKEFNYLCLGIQESGNTRKQFETAAELKISFIIADDLHHGLSDQVQTQIQTFLDQVDQVYLSIDLDVFATAFAPGVSAPSAFGLPPYVVLPLLKYILGSGKVLTVDVVELNPSLDLDSRTAQLAASLIYQVVKGWV